MITIIASFHVKQECVDASRQEEGNSSYHLYTGKIDGTKFFFVEN